MPSPQEIPVLLTLTSQLTPPPHPSAAKRVAGPLYRFVKGRKVSAFINENFDALQREASWVRRSHAPWIREKLERLQPLARGEATDRLQALFNAVNPETAPNVPPCTLGGVMLASYLERAIVEQELEEWTHQHRSKLASRKAFFKSARRAYRNDSCSFDATPIRNESELPGVLHRYTALQTVTLADGRSLEWQPMSPEPTGLPESTPMSFAKNLWNFRSKAQKHEKGEFDLDYLLKFGAANSLSETERTNLTDWIARIKEIWEYIRFGPRLCHAVCEILQDVGRHEEFRRLFFTQLADNLECCAHRASMSFNEVYTSWRLHCMDDSAPLEERRKLLIGLAKTLELRKNISNRISKAEWDANDFHSKEAVEVYLYYETRLRKPLGLVTGIHNPLLLFLGRVSAWDRKEMIAEVNASFIHSLVALPQFQDYFANDPEYQALHSRAMDSAYADLERLNAQLEEGSINEGRYVELTNDLRQRAHVDAIRTWLAQHPELLVGEAAMSAQA